MSSTMTEQRHETFAYRRCGFCGDGSAGPSGAGAKSRELGNRSADPKGGASREPRLRFNSAKSGRRHRSDDAGYGYCAQLRYRRDSAKRIAGYSTFIHVALRCSA